jgi:UDP-N-acetylmuramoyl-L-alanyl-D-glutamate--2,6-diaminopimelate ligase
MNMPAESLSTGPDLQQLLEGLADAPPAAISGINSDSRQIKPGDVFVACAGIDSHGLDFLQQAVDAGAAAVIWDSSGAESRNPAGDLPMVAVPGLAAQVGMIADRWFESPSQSMRITGVTGTNGKTTVAYLIAQCLQMLDHKCAYIGTLGSGISELDTSSGMTTPACIEMHRQLAGFRDAGAQFAALEVSSHALEQGRVDGVLFDAVIFTNLSRDHIDYHGDMHAYGEAKARLFLEFDAVHRIVNIDTEFGQQLADRCGDTAITVSTSRDKAPNGRAYVFVRSVTALADGSVVAVETSWGDAEFMLPLVGNFNVENAAEVLALLLCLETPLALACDLLEGVQAPPGRMQRIEIESTRALPAVYVDYAHTPAALDLALNTLNAHCEGELWCVFGCGGDRDQGKRPLMGQAVAQHASHAVVTNDNPRFENPGDIIRQVIDGMPGNVTAIEDRSAAIAWGISNAQENDIVLIAGKGHEVTQQIGDTFLPFSDYESAYANLAKRSSTGPVQ